MGNVISLTNAEDLTRILSGLKSEHTLIIKTNNGRFDVRIIKSQGAEITLPKPNNPENKASNIENDISLIRSNVNPYEESFLDLFLLKNGNKNDIIDLSHIIYLEADSNYTFVNTQHKRYAIKRSLKSIQASLNDKFQQCHKKYCINIDYLRSIQNSTVYLYGDHTIPVSKFYKKKFIDSVSKYLRLKKY